MERWRKFVDYVRSKFRRQPRPQAVRQTGQLKVSIRFEHLEAMLRRYRLATEDELKRLRTDRDFADWWGRQIMSVVTNRYTREAHRRGTPVTAQKLHGWATEAALRVARQRWQAQRFKRWRNVDQWLLVLAIVVAVWWMVVYPAIKASASMILATPFLAVVGYIMILFCVCLHLSYGWLAWRFSQRINLLELDALLFVRRTARDPECGRMVDVAVSSRENGQQS